MKFVLLFNLNFLFYTLIVRNWLISMNANVAHEPTRYGDWKKSRITSDF